MRLPKRWKAERDASLKTLGMKNYAEYLASPLWLSIRRRVYARAHGVCESKGCDRAPAAVHHWTYALKVMRGATLKGLEAVCADCHERYHTPRVNPVKAAKRAQKAAWRAWVASGGAVARSLTNEKPRLVKRP